MSVSQPTPASPEGEGVAAIPSPFFAASAMPATTVLRLSSSGDQLREAAEAVEVTLQNDSFLSVMETEKEAADSTAHRAAASSASGFLLPAQVVSFVDVSKRQKPMPSFSMQSSSARMARFRVKGPLCGPRALPAHVQGVCRDPSTLSILDLAAMDLEQLKKSFIAHAQVFGRGDLLDLYKVAGDVAREAHYAERAPERLQRRGQIHTPRKHNKRLNDMALGSTSALSCPEEVGAADSAASIAEDSIANLPMNESSILARGLSSQKTRLLSVWLYDRLVEQQLCDFRNPASKSPHESPQGTAMLSPRSFLGLGTKAMMVKLRGPPTPQQLAAFDIFDELSRRQRERASGAALDAAHTSVENIPMPLPAFVYVFSRAVFRMCYLGRFPKGTFSSFSPSSSTPAAPSASTGAADVVRKESPAVAFAAICNHDSLLQEAANLLEECRHVVMRFFELFDADRRGEFAWSTFTDMLMERVEVQHRLMMVKESSELNVQSDARVFDEYVLEPFPSVLQRLGYVGAVLEVRYSRSAIVVEGPYDFAVCDSAYNSLIQRKLLVRSADALFAHRKGAPEEWSAERWELAAESAANAHPEQKCQRKIVRYEDGRSPNDEAAAKLRRNAPDADEKEGAAEGNSPAAGSTEDRIDRRVKPSMQAALQVQDVSPELPTTFVTLHSDLLLRFFNIEQHIWVIPETITVSCTETVTSMEWHPASPEGEMTLRWYIFLGTRSGFVLKVHLREIMQKMLHVVRVRGDVMTTGMAAMETVREKLGPYILQRQKVHNEFVTALSLTPAGVLLSASLDGTVVLSRASNLAQLRSFRVGNDAGVRFACITPLRNIIVTLSAANGLALWGNTHQSSHVELYDPISPHYFPIISVTVDESLEQLISVDSSGYAKVWSLRTSLIKMSFYAVSQEAFSAFGHMYSTENRLEHNGHRLFDVDETDKRRSRLTYAGGQHGAATGLQTALAAVEAATKAKIFSPARYVAYDGLSRRLFVSGAKNNVVCVFVSGLTSSKAHSSPICHLSVCERHRGVLSASNADCRLWNYNTGTLSLGLKANSPEFIMVRMAPVYSTRATFTTSAQLVAFSGEPDLHTLDACKQPSPTLGDVISAVYARAGAQRRERSAKRIPNRMTSADKMRRDAVRSKLNRNAAGGVVASSSMGAGAAVAPAAAAALSSSAAAMGVGGVGDAGSGMDFGSAFAAEDNFLKNQGTTYRILCAHADPQERYIFYALNNGDIRVHQSDSGRLSKTLVTMPPSTDLILTAVVQCRHLFTAAKRYTEQAYSRFTDDAETSHGLTSTQMRVHEIAFILHRLLYHEKTLALQQEEEFSIHKEAVGMMTMRDAHELGVVYADGVIRFFPLVGSSVQAHRIIIPEFLVSRATSYMRLERSLQKKLATVSHEFVHAKDVTEAAEPQLNFIVEADAVSFVTVSNTLGYVCLVQVNGRISIMDMRTQTGSVVQVFTVSGEVSAVAFLGAYPCLVVADTQGTISFFLVSGAAMLNLLEDFYKSLLLHRRHQRPQHPLPVGQEKQSDDSYKSSSGYSLRMWWFHVPGTPTALHFDPVHGALYIGTRQGYFSSYLVRNLIVAFDLHPILPPNRGGKSHEPHTPPARQHYDSNEQRLFNVLLVFFGITPERVMLYLDGERAALSAYWRATRPGTGNSAPSVSWRGAADSTPPLQVHRTPSPGGNSMDNTGSGTSPAVTRMWRSSLSWIFEACKALFFPPAPSTPSRDASDAENLPFDIRTVTLSDLLIGTAILRHALLLMSMLPSYSATMKPATGKVSAAAAADHPAAVSLTVSDIRHIRQCIVEEILYRKGMQGGEQERYEAATAGDVQGDLHHAVEEEFDPETVRENSYVLPTAIAANWVELLFRRHVVNAANESPLSLLSPSGILERARCERYERCKLLQLQCELEQDAQKEFIGCSWALNPTAGRSTAITVDWDAFLEGNLTHLIEEVFRRRRGMTNVTEEEMLNTVDDGGGVRCITTRRNGMVFVGSANGSVAVWTPYGAARLQELCPSMLLGESLRHLGSTLKARLAQEVARATRRRQREAYAASLRDAKGHDTMLRNLNVKYKAAMMKQKKARARVMEQSTTGLSALLMDATTSLHSTAPSPQFKSGYSSRASLISLASTYDKANVLLEKEKEVLLALLNSTPAEAAERGLLIEDLYFLPMHTAMLSELEEFDLDAYGLAVDLALARLQRDVCGDAATEEAEGETLVDSRCGSVMEVRFNRPGDEGNVASTHASSFRWGSSWAAGGEAGDEARHEEFNTFLLTAHEKLEAAFCAEELSHMRWKQAPPQPAPSRRVSKRQRKQLGSSINCREWRRSVFGQYTAEFSQASTISWTLPHERNLPAYARPGRWLGPGVITVAVSTRHLRHLMGCFGLELERMAAAASWHGVDEAIQAMITQSRGLLSNESLAGLSRSLTRLVSRHVRGGFGPQASFYAKREKKYEAQPSKPAALLMEPLLLIASNHKGDTESSINECFQQPSGESRTPPVHAFTSDGMDTTGRLEELGTGSKERFTFFLTEAREGSPSAASAAAASSTPFAGAGTRQPSRQQQRRGSNSSLSLGTDDDNFDAAPRVLMQWSLHKKDHSHRARLSRTGRVTADIARPPSLPSSYKSSSAAPRESGEHCANASRNTVALEAPLGTRPHSLETSVSATAMQEGGKQPKGPSAPQTGYRRLSNSVSLPSLNPNEMRAPPKRLQREAAPLSKTQPQLSAVTHRPRRRG
ncbi:uncharacterized protein Tco025E_05810 [Trypanosoma conorhini]|uniref:Uncharacterized protein n=1 Tax=Trypanosoma conorhini TaxID=83891 RepID=A0A3R7KW21_9TRYP|nr:uncharacterized protein Tco025E_05810 [Trypanosoma conorhini]RNF14518.1 hypothetical protein Tco025E_05810 [Trypanosoma conorhini]